MDVKWVAALDVGGTHISAGLVSAAGEIRHQREIASHDPDAKDPLRVRLINLTGELLELAESDGIEPVGIALGVPGIVDSEKGLLVAASNLPELFGQPLGQDLGDEFNLPAQLENDVNARAVGEMIFGVARGVSNFALFSVGTDLGGGIIINGRLLRGTHYIAAEFGHLVLDLQGQQCKCGGFGCASEYVSGAGIAQKAREKLTDDSAVLKKADNDRENITARMVFEAAREGDREALSLVEEFSRRFGAVVADVMKVLDPEIIVLAGEIYRQAPELINELVHWARHYYFPIPRLPDFRVSELTKDTAILGPAAAFFLSRDIPAGPEHHAPRHHKKE